MNERTNERTIPVEATKYTSLANLSPHAVVCTAHIKAFVWIARRVLFILLQHIRAHITIYRVVMSTVLPIPFHVQFQWGIVCFWSTRLFFPSGLLCAVLFASSLRLVFYHWSWTSAKVTQYFVGMETVIEWFYRVFWLVLLKNCTFDAEFFFFCIRRQRSRASSLSSFILLVASKYLSMCVHQHLL